MVRRSKVTHQEDQQHQWYDFVCKARLISPMDALMGTIIPENRTINITDHPDALMDAAATTSINFTIDWRLTDRNNWNKWLKLTTTSIAMKDLLELQVEMIPPMKLAPCFDVVTGIRRVAFTIAK